MSTPESPDNPNPETVAFDTYRQAILHLAHFDLRNHAIEMAIRSVLSSRRPFGRSGVQEAVLSAALDELERVAAAEKPDWGTVTKTDAKETP